MAGIERFIVVDPATSEEVRDRVRTAIDDGSKELTLTLVADDTPLSPRITITFHPEITRYQQMFNEYLGESDDPAGTMTIQVFTHSDLLREAATATLVRHE